MKSQEVADLIRKHVRLEWRGHDDADINPRSVTAAAEAIAAAEEHPSNDTLKMLGAFDRKTKVDKHTATHWGYLRGVIDKLDAAGHSDAADVLIWQVWHRVNREARTHEYLGVERDHRAAVERDYHLMCEEERRLRHRLENGPTTPQECAEFCKSARADGDGEPCLDCDPARFAL